MIEHANDFSRLIAHDLILLLVVESRYCETAIVVRFHIEVDVAQVCKVLMKRVGCHIVTSNILAFLRKAPAFITLATSKVMRRHFTHPSRACANAQMYTG